MGVRDDILGFTDLKRKEVDVPQWGKTLTVQELGFQDSISMFESFEDDDIENGKARVRPLDVARVVAWGVIDPETGERIFSDEDVPALAKKNQKALMLLYTEITALAGSVEAARKN